MTKNPFINAVAATSYIVIIVTIMTIVTQPLKNKPDTIFTPIVVLSVFTLSAAVMAFIFFYQPVLMLLEGKKKDAVDLFFKTVGTFAVFTGLAIILLSLGLL